MQNINQNFLRLVICNICRIELSNSIIYIGVMVGKGFNGMHQLVTKIRTLNVVACKTSTIISKSKRGHNLHYMLDKVIVLDCLHRCRCDIEIECFCNEGQSGVTK